MEVSLRGVRYLRRHGLSPRARRIGCTLAVRGPARMRVLVPVVGRPGPLLLASAGRFHLSALTAESAALRLEKAPLFFFFLLSVSL